MWYVSLNYPLSFISLFIYQTRKLKFGRGSFSWSYRIWIHWFPFALRMWAGEMGLSCNYKGMSLILEIFKQKNNCQGDATWCIEKATYNFSSSWVHLSVVLRRSFLNMGFRNFGYVKKLYAKSYVYVSVRISAYLCGVVFGCVGEYGCVWVCFFKRTNGPIVTTQFSGVPMIQKMFIIKSLFHRYGVLN